MSKWCTAGTEGPASSAHNWGYTSFAILTTLFLCSALLCKVNFAAISVLFGDTAVETTLDSDDLGSAEAFPSTVSTTGTLGSLTVYLDPASTATQLIVGIYANAAGHPGTLLSQGSSTTLQAGTWNTLNIPSVGVNAGTVYWIAILGTGGTLYFRDTNNGSCYSESSAQSNLTTLPASWASGSRWPSCRLSAYGGAALGTVLSVTPANLTFSGTQGSSNPAPLPLSVANNGGGTLAFSASTDAAWLMVSPSNGTAPQTLEVSTTSAGLAPNTYIGHVTVSSPGSAGSPTVVTTTLTVSAPAPLPLPTLSSLSPSSRNAGGSAFALTVNGSNFVSGNTVLWNGSALATSFGSSTQLSAAVPAALIANMGTASVAVQTAAGGTSNSLSFAINPPLPSLSMLSPSSALAGGAQFTLTVNGGNFVSGDTVLWNGTSLVTTFSSSAQLAAIVPASWIVSPGSVSVSAQTAAGAVSRPLGFTVNPPAPTLNSLSPSNTLAGGAAFTLSVNGTNFVSGDTVLWNGASLATTFARATQLTAAVPNSLIANSGSASVSVQTPTSGTSNSLTFSVAAAVPTLSSLSPSSAVAGSASFTLTVNGNNFISGDTIDWNGSPLTTVFAATTQLTASVPAASIANPGTESISVKTPSGATSNTLSFVTTTPVPALNSVSPVSAVAGGPGFTLTVNGSNFASGDVVLWNGAALTSSFGNSTQFTASVPASAIAGSGSAAVSVGTPGGTTSNSLTFVVSPSSPTVLIGNQSIASGADSDSPGNSEAFQAMAAATGTLGSLVIYLDSSSTATHLIAGIYADASGHPGTLLSQGNSTTLVASAWNTVPIPAVSVSAGAPYWIAILGTGGALRFRDGSGCVSESSAQTTLSALPSTWSSGSRWPSCPLSAYGLAAGASSGSSLTYSLSGSIAGGAGATVALSGGASAVTTANGSGSYTFSGLGNGTYTVTPSRAGYTFSPSSQSATINGANLSGVNFTAAALTFSLSGTLTPVLGGSGATVTLSGATTASTTSNSSGAYSFSGLTNGSYAVTPSNSGYSFNPSSQAVTINSANITAVNFVATATAPTYSISGTISPASVGAGATVTLSGAASFTTIADASGNFSFATLSNGTYTLTPSSATATFSPTSQTVSISNGNVSGISFTATATSNVIFFDDFMGTSLSSQWVAMNRAGDYSNSEQECYNPSQVSVSNSNLVITSIAQTATCGDANHSPSQFPTLSGMVQWATFHFTYGTVEFRAKMAGGQGTWPAIWLLGANCQPTNVQSADNSGACNWPQPGSDEIDITEILSSNHTAVNQQIHSVNNNSGCTASTSDVSQNFHVYQLIWAASSLEWKIDGTSTCKITSAIPSNPMFLIINTAMGGAGGSINNATLPQSSFVDYIKITQP